MAAPPAPKRRPVYRENPEWLEKTAERIDATRDIYIEEEMPANAELVRAYTMKSTTMHETSSQPSDLLDEARSHRHASLMMHRRGSAVLAAGFNPARHVSMICGRPVVVPL